MSQGIEVWNASGQKILSVTDTITRVLGVVTIDGSQQSGVITIPEITAARGWSFTLRNSTASSGGGFTSYYIPDITIGNGYVQYQYPNVQQSVRQSVYLTVGLR